MTPAKINVTRKLTTLIAQAFYRRQVLRLLHISHPQGSADVLLAEYEYFESHLSNAYRHAFHEYSKRLAERYLRLLSHECPAYKFVKAASPVFSIDVPRYDRTFMVN